MISIVIVNWNSGKLLERCVRSLLDHAAHCEVVVVDNASEDFSLDFAQKVNAPLSLIRNQENLGFAAANNIGWRRSAGDPVLFLNPDTESTPGALTRLAQTLNEDSCAWAAGGKLVSPSGRRQAGFDVRAFPTVGSVAAEMFLLDEIWPRNPWSRRYLWLDENPESLAEVDQPAAACLMVRRPALERLNGFDQNFYPAWFEDVDLCRRIRDRGGRILYQPQAEFLHHGGSSLKHLAREEFLRYFHANEIRYFRKHHGREEADRIRKLICKGLYLRAALSLIRPLVFGATRKSSARTFWRAARYFSGGIPEIS